MTADQISAPFRSTDLALPPGTLEALNSAIGLAQSPNAMTALIALGAITVAILGLLLALSVIRKLAR